ncbi:DUF6799 domain-containing protein [Hymenobacter psychrotolerans]|uniref:DUF6799 domain-containing protein n=1 Tax=Hymenobacter psychrotolerans DSM 18569 TaxID=1121959 RepID=A0A1M7B1K0_9BACT|nr:DUF6799 domain-containing protein [Hymenobacter psychrotolerans]SHL48882.1 hypothetical protein SAMN02746009_02832 [Hymenobacter psychrotolerans DSM 18569]
MKNLPISLLALLLAVAAPLSAAAQTKTEPGPTTRVAATASDQYLMQNGEVVLRQNGRTVSLSKNVVLSNGTKVNYKSGIVEFPTGKKTTLREGDYVTIGGDVVFATPGSAAAARGDNSVPADAKFNKYVDRGTTPTSTTTTIIDSQANDLTTLLSRKIQLLNEKIGLMTPNPANQAAIESLNQQIKTLDAQINR